jgi:hypothetical protein
MRIVFLSFLTLVEETGSANSRICLLYGTIHAEPVSSTKVRKDKKTILPAIGHKKNPKLRQKNASVVLLGCLLTQKYLMMMGKVFLMQDLNTWNTCPGSEEQTILEQLIE